MASERTISYGKGILSRVREDVEGTNPFTERHRFDTLSELKILSRGPQNATPIFEKAGIDLLCQCAFRHYKGDASKEAMRCLANALLLNPASRQVLVDCGYAGDIADRISCERFQDEFLHARLLFLLTYETDLDFVQLVKHHGVAGAILKNLERHSSVSQSRRKDQQPRSNDENMSLQETLKLLFNLTHLFPDVKADFLPTFSPILTILALEPPVAGSPLQAPTSQLINALTTLDPTSAELQVLYPEEDPSRNTNKLLRLLDGSTLVYTAEEMNQHAAPLLLLLRRLYPSAPTSVQSSMRDQLLPTDAERDKPLGQSKTLFSRLLQLSMSSFTPALRDSIAGLMFELSDKDVDAFVKNVGYGFASGFLVNNGIPLGSSGTNSAGHDNEADRRGFNPVTGQFVDKEVVDEGPPMTDEEKEREAERLFVLFERLKQNGIISVENPVETAVKEGRFEEIE